MYVVTGASSGIGQAISTELLVRGQTVVAVATRDGAFNAIESINLGDLIGVKADISTAEGIDRIYNAVSGQTLKGIIHSAGSAISLADYHAIEPRLLTHHMAVHVAAPIALNRRFSKQIDKARIVYIDSYSASQLRVGWCEYSIVKAAAQMAAKAAKAELDTADVIRVFPGGVRTPLVQAVLDAKVSSPTSEAFKAIDAAGDMVEPARVGGFVADILLKASQEQLNERDYWDIANPADGLD